MGSVERKTLGGLLLGGLFAFSFGKAQVVGFEPTGYSPEARALWQANSPPKDWDKDLFPHGSEYYYQYDTLSLPFVDDFSVDRFKNFNPALYPGITVVERNWFHIVNAPDPEPDVFRYVLTAPDSFFINVQGEPDSVTVSEESRVQVLIYDTVVNPFQVKAVLECFRYQPRIIKLPNGNLDTVNGPLDGMLVKKVKAYQIVPPNPLVDSSLWADRDVYISRDLPIGPPTLGAAVFDGLKFNGMPYRPGDASAYGAADQLTSKPIDLSGLTVADSVYLSFWYQRGGRGFEPAERDSLRLEFFAFRQKKWYRVWGMEGGPVDTFRQVIIPVHDTAYLHKGFQFRFRNYASLGGNVDHWLLDYVYLNKNRSIADTTYPDLAFVNPPPSFFRTYTQMPFNHLRQSEVNNKWRIVLTNLDDGPICMLYKNKFFGTENDSITSYPENDFPGPYDYTCMRPTATHGYDQNFRHYFPSFSYNFDVQWPPPGYTNPFPFTDSLDLFVEHRIYPLQDTINRLPFQDFIPSNNRMVYHHKLHNFFSYDDGTAEGAVFLGQPGSVAYKFTLTVPDTLRAVQFHFNPIYVNISHYNIELRVWRSLSNTSEDTVYCEEYVNPQFNPGAPNMWTTFILKRPVPLPAGDFYIGWKQNIFFKLNVGYDRNHDHRNQMFFRTWDTWESWSDYVPVPGCMMIRPIVGKPVKPEDFISVAEPAGNSLEAVLYPNPGHGTFFIRWPEAARLGLRISITDLSGQRVAVQYIQKDHPVQLGDLRAGIYIVQVQDLDSGRQGIFRYVLWAP
ncbi:MAG: T9SS type A sorting domain-containing protein [Flavobacteriales bacterium]|nr:T9SS type A sorting domain-containing protein [Flavobacteriales bacterium]MCX7768838.1 T9SS type A sorting domain-containing protein [Flavobacteriales bacterium]MDW8410508.1 T9SS type A sorting domain-containing protein [Flavobacteriales bacterium]